MRDSEYRVKLKTMKDWVKEIRLRVRRNKDVTIAITGERGVGKSTLMLWLMMYVDVDRYTMTVDFRDVINATEWIPSKWLRRLLTVPRYRAVALDEAGNAWSSLTFRSAVNTALSQTQQSNRFLNQVKILTCPTLRDLDIGGRRTTIYHIDFVDEGEAYVYRMKVSGYSGKEYRYTIGRIEADPLPPHLYALYEKKKHSIEVKRYLERIQMLEKLEKKSDPLTHAITVALLYLRQSPGTILNRRKRLDASALAAFANVSLNTAYKVKKIYDSSASKESVEPGIKALERFLDTGSTI